MDALAAHKMMYYHNATSKKTRGAHHASHPLTCGI